MKSKNVFRIVATLTAGIPVLFLAGCFELDVQTTVSPDGSGQRRMELAVPSEDAVNEETGLTIDDLQTLYNFTEKDGWSLSKELSSSEIVCAFKRLSTTDNLAQWSQPRSDINIKGAMEGDAYKNVAFRNSVQVLSEDGPGGTTYKYREKFYWEGLSEALIEDQVACYRDSLKAKYPELSPEKMGELLGLLKGSYWAAVGEGMYEMSDGERAARFRLLVDAVAKQAAKTVREEHPDADEAYLSDMVLKIVVERDERDEKFLEEKLVGATLALLTKLRVRVSLPGEIIASNAASQDGATLEWRLEPGDAVDRPIEIYAESIVRK
jgi:hypothetical protein